MLGEISAVVSLLKGVQTILSHVSEAKASYDQAADLLGKLGDAQDLIHKREKRLKVKGIIGHREALKIAQKQKEIALARQRVKDHLLMSGHADLIRKQEALVRESQRRHAEWLKTVALRRAERKKKIKTIGIAIFLFFSLIVFSISGYFFREMYLQYKLQDAKERLKESRERTRNYRRCGRPKC